MDNKSRKNVVLGLLGSTLDSGFGPKRWKRWRPTIGLCQQEELTVDRFELLYEARFEELCQRVVEDLHWISPTMEVQPHCLPISDAWDFEDVYAALHDFARGYVFDLDADQYLVHISTGSHVEQICLFLLTESRYLPARLIQTSPPRKGEHVSGGHRIIDLDLSKYDRLASRFVQEQREGATFLKSGIETRNERFNRLIDEIELVATQSKAPLLLTGPTGAGKSQLARKIYELKRARRQLDGAFVEVNCATLRGDAAMSALFGHVKGAFTGALSDRPGLLRAAHGGLLFLDEIGELGQDEQAMLLRALEDRRFLPVGSDAEVQSDFQLIAGTNRQLSAEVACGAFREDLLARINIWTFELPPLRDRTEDIEPNLKYELARFAEQNGVNTTFNKEAYERMLGFAVSSEARWSGNFRDLNAAVTRMATLAGGGRISVDVVEAEIARLRKAWAAPPPSLIPAAQGGSAETNATPAQDADESWLAAVLSPEQLARLDRFDRSQLSEVLRVCKCSRTLSDAGRQLFAASRQEKKSSNDADRLRKYLARFGLSWQALR